MITKESKSFYILKQIKMAKVNFRVCIDDKENPIPYVERTELQKKL